MKKGVIVEFKGVENMTLDKFLNHKIKDLNHKILSVGNTKIKYTYYPKVWPGAKKLGLRKTA